MLDVPVYAVVNLTVTDAAVYCQYEKGVFPLLKKYGGASSLPTTTRPSLWRACRHARAA